MAFPLPGNVKDLMLLVSIFSFAVIFFATFVTGCVLKLPYYEIQDPEPKDELCTNNGVADNCICSVQFAGTPATFLVQVLIYIWLTGTSAFVIANVFRMYKDGKAFCSPAIFSLEVSLLANATLLFYFIWSFLWYYEQWTAGSVVLGLATITSWASVVLYSINLFTETEFLNHNVPRDLWIHRVVVQNGLGMLATWILCMFFTNVATASVHGAGSDPTASAVVIIILTFIFAIWAPLELLVWDKLFRYMISPFLVLVWILMGVFVRLDSNRNSCHDYSLRVYAMVLLIIVTVEFVGRMFFTFYRHFRKPLAKNC